MGAGASTTLSAAVNEARQDELVATIHSLPPEHRAKLVAALDSKRGAGTISVVSVTGDKLLEVPLQGIVWDEVAKKAASQLGLRRSKLVSPAGAELSKTSAEAAALVGGDVITALADGADPMSCDWLVLGAYSYYMTGSTSEDRQSVKLWALPAYIPVPPAYDYDSEFENKLKEGQFELEKEDYDNGELSEEEWAEFKQSTGWKPGSIAPSWLADLISNMKSEWESAVHDSKQEDRVPGTSMFRGLYQELSRTAQKLKELEPLDCSDKYWEESGEGAPMLLLAHLMIGSPDSFCIRVPGGSVAASKVFNACADVLQGATNRAHGLPHGKQLGPEDFKELREGNQIRYTPGVGLHNEGIAFAELASRYPWDPSICASTTWMSTVHAHALEGAKTAVGDGEELLGHVEALQVIKELERVAGAAAKGDSSTEGTYQWWDGSVPVWARTHGAYLGPPVDLGEMRARWERGS
eukprot:TRINITY_DN1056_c0_g1_i1.p1 TRINITY_DN1056_c0_g1~~TRINITY_DN1056_c0_g1_i1.p1  ORF type:complete len:481 (-),score=89.34 TRINITY_DN1056_c0_g1_i1:331-1731(-)